MFLGTSISDPSPFYELPFHLLVTEALSNFNVYKLIGWDPGNIYLFKANSINTRETCEKV